jgi:hypothetical protein
MRLTAAAPTPSLSTPRRVLRPFSRSSSRTASFLSPWLLLLVLTSCLLRHLRLVASPRLLRLGLGLGLGLGLRLRLRLRVPLPLARLLRPLAPRTRAPWQHSMLAWSELLPFLGEECCFCEELRVLHCYMICHIPQFETQVTSSWPNAADIADVSACVYRKQLDLYMAELSACFSSLAPTHMTTTTGIAVTHRQARHPSTSFISNLIQSPASDIPNTKMSSH